MPSATDVITTDTVPSDDERQLLSTQTVDGVTLTWDGESGVELSGNLDVVSKLGVKGGPSCNVIDGADLEADTPYRTPLHNEKHPDISHVDLLICDGGACECPADFESGVKFDYDAETGEWLDEDGQELSEYGIEIISRKYALVDNEEVSLGEDGDELTELEFVRVETEHCELEATAFVGQRETSSANLDDVTELKGEDHVNRQNKTLVRAISHVTFVCV